MYLVDIGLFYIIIYNSVNKKIILCKAIDIEVAISLSCELICVNQSK